MCVDLKIQTQDIPYSPVTLKDACRQVLPLANAIL
jgi:hypothetical protein